MALFVAGLALLAVGAARPQASVPVPQTSVTILLALDTSGSMCSTDVDPNRLTAARKAATEFIESQRGGPRIGLVTFAGTAGLLVPPTDDTDSLYQVLTRRLAYVDRPEDDERETLGGAIVADAESPEATADGEVVTTRKRPRFAYRPQLLVVDGGQPQVAAAARALADAGHEEIALCGIAKRLEEVWLPGEDYPVILPRTSEALYLLQRLRDEAHRFAITHQRKRRKRDISSVLTEVPGLGDARIKALLRHFGSVTALKNASPAEIMELPGIGPTLAEAIHARLSR